MERKITIQEEQVFLEDYQIKMLKENRVEGLLVMKGRGVDGVSFFDYDVSGKMSLQALFSSHKMTSEELVLFLLQVKEAVRNVREYLLDFHKLLLKPEYIYYDNQRFFFCYFPYADQNFWEELHALAEYFVQVADFDEKLCGKMVMQFHTDTAKENYSLEGVIKNCMGIKEEKKGYSTLNSGKEERGRREAGKELWIAEDDVDEEESYGNGGYDTYYHDQIKDSRADNLLRESDHFWLPMKGFLKRNKKKRNRWGDWEDLYTD